MKYKSLIIAALAVSFAGCTNQPQTTPIELEFPVTINEVKTSSISQFFNTTGTALPTFGVELNSEMSGLYKLQNNPATGRPFKPGDAVRRDQVIIRLEDRAFENGIAIESKKLSLEIAQQEQSKQKELYELGGVTLSEMRNTEIRVTNATYDLDNANINLQRMVVKSPFDGVIVSLPHYTTDVKVESGRPMVGIMNYSRMYMDINLPESAISYVKVNQPVNITQYTLLNDTLRGTITELSPAISTETRTFKGKILIDNSELKLRPGMFAKADVVIERAEDVIVIPKNVILSQRNRKYVFIVERGVAVIRNIVTGIEDDDKAEVVRGLNENDNLVVRGFETLRENSRVKILQ
jgi:RND family efflux transporter MFP subunit